MFPTFARAIPVVHCRKTLGFGVDAPSNLACGDLGTGLAMMEGERRNEASDPKEDVMNKHLKKAATAMAAGALMLAAAGTATLAGDGAEIAQRYKDRNAAQINFKPGNLQQVKPGNDQISFRHQPSKSEVSYRSRFDTRRAGLLSRTALGLGIASVTLGGYEIHLLGGTRMDGGWACSSRDAAGLEQFGANVALRCP
jgi:hypothetical protein